ncbi:MAG: YfiR/HmsC family protein [Microscillaceae bacterium]|nr:YfiR/HmsC family protein [Microscillaceae bacterium]
MTYKKVYHIVMGCWVFFLLNILPTKAQEDQNINIKANYIIRFANNLIWPSYAIGNEFVVGFIGDEATAQKISSFLSNQKVKNKKYALKRYNTIQEIEQCPILFISASNKLLISGIFQQVSGKPILVISEKPGYADHEGGSDINFVKPVDEWLYEIVVEQIQSKGIYIPDKIIASAYKNISYKEEVVPAKTITKIEKTTEIKYVKDPKIERELNVTRDELTKVRVEQTQRIKELGLNPQEEKELIARLDTLRRLRDIESVINEQLKAEKEKEKAERQLALEKAAKIDKEKEALVANQRTQLAIFSAIFILISTLTLVFYRYNQRKKRTIIEIKKARNELADKVREINRQNDLLEESAKIMDMKSREINEKNLALEEQNRKITDSIRYALTIQEAMLPGEKKFQEIFDEHFIIYRPKDIVSGDFYWLTQSENKTVIVVVDCTGHGVPGAFMSTIGTDLLNEIINEKRVYNPSRILEMLHLGVYERLRQSDTNNRDGMDVCMCLIQAQENDRFQVIFAGAKRPLFFTQSGELKRISGDSKYIGGIRKHTQAFTNQEVILKKGDVLYLTTDGYVDTPNPQREKFGSNQFVQLLSSIHSKHLHIQKEIMLDVLQKHQQNTKSRDDITIVGIKL